MEYTTGPGPPERARYLDKLTLIGGQDPKELDPSTWTTDDPKLLPSIFQFKTLLQTQVHITHGKPSYKIE